MLEMEVASKWKELQKNLAQRVFKKERKEKKKVMAKVRHSFTII